MQLCSKKISQKNSKHILEFLHVFIIGAEKMDYTVENLEKVVTMFYRTEANQQAEAHLWLTEAQNSPAAWSFVWELLSHHRVLIKSIRFYILKFILIVEFRSAVFCSNHIAYKIIKILG